jgi:hypothetical protein
MKMINVQDVKHPISLYLYDTPGDLDKIKEDAVVFPEIDILMVIIDGDNDDHLSPAAIGLYNTYISKNLAKYCPKAASILRGRGDASPLDNAVTPISVSKQRMLGQYEKVVIEEPREEKKEEADESMLTPLHYLHNLGAGTKAEELSEYPKVVYVFTHRDKIDAKGTAYDELMHNHRTKLISSGVITKNLYLVSSRIYTDVHLMFKKEIQFKLRASQLFKT